MKKKYNEKRYISQKDFSLLMGVSGPYITKLKKKGVFDKCYEGRYLLRDRAIKTYVFYNHKSNDYDQLVSLGLVVPKDEIRRKYLKILREVEKTKDIEKIKSLIRNQLY